MGSHSPGRVSAGQWRAEQGRGGKSRPCEQSRAREGRVGPAESRAGQGRAEQALRRAHSGRFFLLENVALEAALHKNPNGFLFVFQII